MEAIVDFVVVRSGGRTSVQGDRKCVHGDAIRIQDPIVGQ